MLFDNLQTITYTIGGKEYLISDIFRSISIKNISGNAFDEMYIEEGETPESVSTKIYGAPAYSWLILLVNNIADLKNEWFIDYNLFLEKRELQVGGDAIYIANLPDLERGDLVVKVSTTTDNEVSSVDNSIYRVVADFDKTYRRIRGISGAGVITTGDLICFARKENNNNIRILSFGNTAADQTNTEYAQVLFTEKFVESPDFFHTGIFGVAGQAIVVQNPYRKVVPSSEFVSYDAVYTNPADSLSDDNFAYTILYDYFSNAGSFTSGTGIQSSTINTKVNSEHFSKQKIKIIKSEYLQTVLLTIKVALESKEVGRSFSVVI